MNRRRAARNAHVDPFDPKSVPNKERLHHEISQRPKRGVLSFAPERKAAHLDRAVRLCLPFALLILAANLLRDAARRSRREERDRVSALNKSLAGIGADTVIGRKLRLVIRTEK